MGFNQDDAAALNSAQPYFAPMVVDTGHPQYGLMHFKVDKDILPPSSAMTLTLAMEAAMRMHEGMSIWLDVTTIDFPAYVTDAIRHCAGFGLKVVVTWNGRSSHEPGAPMPTELLAAIRQSQASEPLWHPVTKQPVQPLR